MISVVYFRVDTAFIGSITEYPESSQIVSFSSFAFLFGLAVVVKTLMLLT